MTKANMKNSVNSLSSCYDENFYRIQIDASYRSALFFSDILTSLYKPNSVVDVGCGRGTWLKAFKEKGATLLVGFDGPWNSQDDMIEQSITFHAVDLNKPINPADCQKFDLAISMEVAEHLEPASAWTFIESLTALSDVVLFSSAYTKQGGSNHINEQPHSYWAKIFASFNYVPFDIFRPVVWGNKDIKWYYQQNTFLYVHKSHPLFESLVKTGISPIINTAFMDCIHPALYEKYASDSMKDLIKRLAIKIIPKPLHQFARKVKQMFFK